MQDNQTNTTYIEEQIDFTYYFSVILKYAWLIISFVVVGIVIAILINLFMQPVYKSTVLLMIDREDAGKIETTSFSSWTSDEDYYRTQYQLLESRTLLEKVYKAMNLDQYLEFANPNGWLKLKSHLKISPIQRSRLVNLEVTSFDKVLAKNIANAIATTFVQDNVANRVSIAKDVISALESTQQSQQEEELLNSMPQVVNSDFIKGLKNQEISLQNQYAKLTAKYTQYHPDVVALQNQINLIKQKIDLETRRLIQSIKIELSGHFSGNNIRIVDYAIVDQNPYRPNKLINLLIGFIAGLFLGVMISFVLEFLDKTIKTSEQLQEQLKLAFLGFVPFEKHSKDGKEYGQLLKTDTTNLLAEQIRNLRTMLSFTLSDEDSNAMLITSSVQSEGKSFISSNLAVALSQLNKKVLLIDGDLRRSKLHKVFKLSNEKGLSSIWNSKQASNDFSLSIKKTDVQNLDVVTSGIRPPNPSELLNTPLLNKFVQWAKDNYDIVLIDCPAVFPVSDTLLWGKYINKAIFVIKYGQTNSNVAKICVDRIKKSNIKILGAVISQYKAKGITYGKYNYYKNYSYYSDEKQKNK